MVFWKKKRQENEEPSEPAKVVSRSGPRRQFPVEVKILAAKARAQGLSSSEVSRIVGSSTHSVDKWWHLYREGGAEALVTKRGNPKTRKLHEEIERRIEHHRR